MRNLKDYRLFESEKDWYKHNDIYYDKKWKLPTSSLRLEIEEDVNEMSLEVTDLGYSYQIGGFISKDDHPYVWIGGKIPGNAKLKPRKIIEYEDITYFIEKLKVYFSDKGFETREGFLPGQYRENSRQVYLYFWPKKDLE